MRHRRLLLGIPATAAAALTAAAVAIGAPGDNDTTYGSKGIAQVPTGNGGRSSAEASVLQGDKLVVVGQARADTGAGLRAEIAITRLNADGSRDASFGTNGETLVAAGTGESEALAVTIAPDGKIVAAGRAVDGPATKLAIVRLSADGAPDPTFGGAGVSLVNRGNAGVAAVEGVAAEADGRVVVASTVVDAGVNKISLARLSPGGVSEAWGGLTPAGDGTDTRAAGLTRLPDGSYAVAGRATEGGATKLLLARFAAGTGALTGGWGNKGNGVSLLDAGDGGAAIGNGLAASGQRVVVAGSATDDNVGKTVVAAFNAVSGQPDGAFGVGGTSLAAIGTGGSSEAAGVAIAGDGKILTGGSATQDTGGVATSQFAAARFLPTGALDTSFAPASTTPGAALVTSPGLPSFGSALTPQADGKLLVAGRVGDGDGETLAVARFCSADGQACVGSGGGTGLPGGIPNPADAVRPPFECGKVVAFGLIQAEGCLKAIEGGKFEASGRVNVNGIIMQPEAKSTIILDPTALRLYVDGPANALGKLSARIGTITVFENLPLDIRLPSKTLDQLKLPNLKVSARGSVFGFPIGGSADLQLRKGGVELTVNVSLPKIFGGVTGTVVLRADLKDGFRPDGITITAKEALLGPLKVQDVLISYRDSDKQWSGKATVFLVPFPYAAQAEVSVQNGSLKKLVAGVDGLNIAAGPGVFLQRISFGISVDPFTIQGGVGFTAGPKIGDVAALRIDGNFRLSFPGSPLARIEVAAGSFCQVSKCAEGAEDKGADGLTLVGLPLGGFAFSADTDGQIAFSGNIGLDLAIVSLNAQVSGWLDGLKAFNVEGSGTACVFSVACVTAEGVISSEGLAACGSINLAAVEVGVGFGIKWPTSISVMGPSCDIGDYRATRANGARLGLPGRIGVRAQTGPQTVTFPAGEDYALVKLTGDTAPPEVTLAGGPANTQITTPAAPSKGVKNADSMVFKDYEKKQTIFVVTKPGTQPWTITPQPGSAVITAVEQADPLPEPSVKAKVSGSGFSRKLTYSVKKIDGQKVRFAEVGGGVTHVLGETTKTSGSISFTPRDGAKGSRKIEATVIQGDLPREALTVAKYAAPGRRLPARIRSVSVSRGKSSATVRWTPSANADTYRVLAIISDGRKVMLTAPRKTRRITVPDVTAKDSVKLTVRGVTEAMRTGPTTAATLKLPSKKTTKAKK